MLENTIGILQMSNDMITNILNLVKKRFEA